MLTLRGPIQLKTGLRLTGASEGFCQRLMGNYGLMTAHVAPKDLLFLLLAPPELPEDLGGGTSLNLSNSFTDVQNVTMDVVNNVVNRIVLEQENRFTYQDQVYITSVLRKLGVSDVSQFMEEVRRLREEQRTQAELTRLYSRETVQKALALLTEGEGGKQAAVPARPAGEEGEPPAPRYYLHQEIYRRLHTGDIYQEVTAFHQSPSPGELTITNNAFKLSEQLQVSNSLRLEELKQKTIHGGAVTLHHHVNRYEQGELLPPPATEEAVLSQAAEAALLSTVDQVTTQILHRERAGRQTWLQLEHSLSQTAEHSLSRFEYAHREHTANVERSAEYRQWHRSLVKEELEHLHRLTERWQEGERVTRELQTMGGGETPPRTLLLAPDTPEEGAAGEGEPARAERPPGPGLTTRELTQLTQSILSRGGAGKEMARPGPDAVPTELTVQEKLIHRERELLRASRVEAQSLRELAGIQRELLLLEQEEGARPQPAVQLPPIPRTGKERGIQAGELLRQVPGGYDRPPAERVLAPLPERGPEEETEGKPLGGTAAGEAPAARPAERPAQAAGPAAPAAPAARALERLLRETRRQIVEQAGRAPGVGLTPAGGAEEADGRSGGHTGAAPEEPAAPASPPAAAVPDPALLEREVREIDRQNRERYERLQETRLEHLRETERRGADPGRTMAEALQAVQAPEKALQQLLESAGQQPPRRAGVPPEVAQILQQADPVTREIYQTLLQYQRDPASVAGQGLVRPGSVGALNAEAARLEAAAPAQEDRRAAGTAEDREAQETARREAASLETLRELPKRGSAQPRRRGEWGKAPIVLRREEGSYLEELLQQLEERRVQSTASHTVREDVTQTHTSQVRVTDQTTQVVAQSVEDITALVNRTMARQMNAITDKVYRQMEKKLQAERNRRGRF